MKLGAQLYSVRNATRTPQELAQTFARLKEIGYENVQLSGAGKIEPERLRDISAESGLPIVCTHSPYDRIIGDTEALIKEHRIYGCPVIGLGSMPKPMRKGGQEALDAFIDELSEPVQRIREAGLNFAYHNHAFEFTMLPEGVENAYDQMLRRRPDWQFIMDSYWVEFAGRSAVEYIAKIGAPRLVNIHFKDMASDEKRSICPCGKGTLDFAAIFEACRGVGVENVLVEQDNAPESPDAFADMEFSFRHLRPIVH
ncbi:MAG: sugar phosphate isomerase/epimerase family protein [Eubacteriales bacterium]